MIFFMYDYIKIQLQRKKDMITRSIANLESGNENLEHFQEIKNFLNNANHQEESIFDTTVSSKQCAE